MLVPTSHNLDIKYVVRLTGLDPSSHWDLHSRRNYYYYPRAQHAQLQTLAGFVRGLLPMKKYAAEAYYHCSSFLAKVFSVTENNISELYSSSADTAKIIKEINA